MKKWFGKLLPSFLMCIVGIAAVVIGITYFNFISQRIYDDSTGHLEEIYDQVNRSFGSFVERNWGLLESWGDYPALTGRSENGSTAISETENDRPVISETESGSSGSFSDFIRKEQSYWGFSGFYFLSKDKSCMTLDGQTGLGSSYLAKGACQGQRKYFLRPGTHRVCRSCSARRVRRIRF